MPIALGLAAACEHNPVDPIELPAGAIEFAPDQFYPQWWAEGEQCSGKTGDFSAVRWYTVPGTYTFPVPDGGQATGAYYPGFNAIVLAETARDEPYVVRHEELHAILHTSGYPPEYFSDKCGRLVNIP